jgi:hypothetical protein
MFHIALQNETKISKRPLNAQFPLPNWLGPRQFGAGRQRLEGTPREGDLDMTKLKKGAKGAEVKTLQ